MSIHQRLEQTRKLRGMSLRELAEAAGVSHEAIRKYESGRDVPSSGVLLRISRALDVPVVSFFRSVTLGEIEPVFRKKKKLSARGLLKVKAEIRDSVERYLEIEAIRMPEAEPSNLPPEFPRLVSSPDEIEESAELLRDAWKLGRDPIENLTELLEEQGIKVVQVAGADGFDACTFHITHDGSKSPVIALRAGLPGDRQRFNLAHELGHLVLVPGGSVEEEPMAQHFAGAFLAPRERVIAELGASRSHLDLVELHLLKHKYGLSMNAWIYRARTVGVLRPRVAAALFKWFSANGWRRTEPGDALRPEEPGRFRRLILQAVAEEQISRRRASEILSEPFDAFLESISGEHEGLATAVGSGY